MIYKDADTIYGIVNRLVQSSPKMSKGVFLLKNNTLKSISPLIDRIKAQIDFINSEEIMTDSDGAVMFDEKGNPKVSKENLKNKENRIKEFLAKDELDVDVYMVNYFDFSELERKIIEPQSEEIHILFSKFIYNLPQYKELTYEEFINNPT